jgi:hypothetical protein
VFRNKLNKDGHVTKNEVMLLSKGYAQVEGIYFEENFNLVSRMEAIIMILACPCSKGIRVYQIDVKSTFLNGKAEEEVYIEQPEGFLVLEIEYYVFILKKYMYGLKKSHRAKYSRLNK